MALVTDALRSPGRRESIQDAVWEGIDRKSRLLAAESPTQAMSAIFKRLAMPTCMISRMRRRWASCRRRDPDSIHCRHRKKPCEGG